MQFKNIPILRNQSDFSLLISFLYHANPILSRCDFTFTSYSYSDTNLAGTLNGYNSTTYPLIENYVNDYLIPYIAGYNDGVSNKTYEIFNKVYYSTGTISEDGKQLTATNPTFYIYLANGQLVGGLPAFKFTNEDAMLIGWQDVTNSHTTNRYNIIYKE